MKKLYTITYTVVGNSRTDFMDMWAESITEAVKVFVNFDHYIEGEPFKYSESAINSITKLKGGNE